MGTRALISKESKPFIATHWDGYPSSLGADLLKAGTKDEDIMAVANTHTIDFAALRVRKIINKTRFKEIANRANKGLKAQGKKKRYTPKDVEDLDKQGKQLNFNLMSAGDDYPVSNIKGYGDIAAYEYNLENGVWYYRSLSGCCPESRHGKFYKLTKAACKEQE